MHRNARTLATLFVVAAAASAAARPVSGASLNARAADVAPAETLRFVTVPDSNTARYRVREQLVGVDFPSDAVGTTGGVTGGITMLADGKVLPDSRFIVDVSLLKSDKSRRDSYVHNHILFTKTFPNVTLAVKNINGVHFPLAGGPLRFRLIGDLTVHGVTKSAIWNVTATMDSAGISGTASTTFSFGEFKLTKPKASVVLSVEDTIKLEYDFRLIRK